MATLAIMSDGRMGRVARNHSSARFPGFLGGKSELVAPRLLGCEIDCQINGINSRVRIVETEAYHQSDAASHSYRGETPRTKAMFGPSGHAYVYFMYGMHYCLNIVTGQTGEGAGVLIRAVEPIDGIDGLLTNRPVKRQIELTNGPAKLCQALGIKAEINGHDMRRAPLRLIDRPALDMTDMVVSTRIGISRDIDRPWRFYIKSSSYVSKPWI